MIVLPEDVEGLIVESAAWSSESKETAMNLSRVAFRFNHWVKPILYHTIVVPPEMPSVETLLPNATYVRTLVIRLSYSEKLKLVLDACHANIRRLAVSWSVWANLSKECGSIPLESLYLIWEAKISEWSLPPPSLTPLQHPHLLKEIMIFAPSDVEQLIDHRRWAEMYLDGGDLSKGFTSLTHITYICDRPPLILTSLFHRVPSLEILVFAQVRFARLEGECLDGERWDDIPIRPRDDFLARKRREYYPKSFDIYLRSRRDEEILKEWKERGEGRSNVWDRLQHQTSP